MELSDTTGTVWHECQARGGRTLSPENSCRFQDGLQPLLPLFLRLMSELRLFYCSGGVMLTASVLLFWAASKLMVYLPRTARFDLMNPVGEKEKGRGCVGMCVMGAEWSSHAGWWDGGTTPAFPWGPSMFVPLYLNLCLYF